MKLVDAFLLITLLWGGYRGFTKGLIVSVFSSTAWVLATLISCKLLHATVTLYTAWYDLQPIWLPYIVFVLLFILTLIANTLLGKFFKSVIHATFLASFDKLLGSVWGILKWSFYSSMCLWLGNALQLKIPEVYTQDTILFPIIAPLCPQVLTWCMPWMPYLHQFLTRIDTQNQWI